MIKYTDTRVTFSEVPDEVTLCINISGCPFRCVGCHSPQLAEDSGTELNPFTLGLLVAKNYPGITCVSFMGGDAHPEEVSALAGLLKQYGLKTAWYSGGSELPDRIDTSNFDYIKIGPYREDRGSLRSPSTNQRMYSMREGIMEDITYKFWTVSCSETEKLKVLDILLERFPALREQGAVGGSLGLFLAGTTKSFHDIDIIVDDVTPFENLNIPKRELVHPNRLNRSVSYEYEGVKLDILEPIEKAETIITFKGMPVLTPESILNSRRLIGEFIREKYPDCPNKYLDSLEQNDKA